MGDPDPTSSAFFGGRPYLFMVKEKDGLPKCMLKVCGDVRCCPVTCLVGGHMEGRIVGNVGDISKVFDGKVPCSVRCAGLVKEKMQCGL